MLTPNMKIRSRRNHGFTLVEIMIVVAIIGLLAAVAIPNFVKARNTAQKNALKSSGPWKKEKLPEQPLWILKLINTLAVVALIAPAEEPIPTVPSIRHRPAAFQNTRSDDSNPVFRRLRLSHPTRGRFGHGEWDALIAGLLGVNGILKWFLAIGSLYYSPETVPHFKHRRSAACPERCRCDQGLRLLRRNGQLT